MREEDGQLVTQYFLKKSTLSILDTSFRIYFKTPTYLASLGTRYHYLFPEPTRIFPNLLRLWNAYTTGQNYGKEEFVKYKEWLTRELGVSEHQLATRLVYMGKKKATGFVGWVTYESRTSNQWDKLTATLARFAEYSNIGGNRTGGFGATRATNRMMLTLSRSTHPP